MQTFASLTAGAVALELFPAEAISPAMLRAWRAVFDPSTLFLPVGSITSANMGAYRAAGANGFGIGSALYKPGLDAGAVRANALAFAAVYRAF